MAGCSGEENLPSTASAEADRLPLRLEATLETGSAVTRASGHEFEAGDILLAYFRHVTGDTKGSYAPVVADQATKLVALKMSDEPTMARKDATDEYETSDFNAVSLADYTTPEPLYWDDFSTGGIGDDTHLRTTGHGLQSYYGYCLNGGGTYNTVAGRVSTALDRSAGTLGWTLPTNYGSATTVKNADLLWSAEQEKKVYGHSTARDATDHGTIVIPYTHAMSQMTVTLTAGVGFTGTPLANTTLTLQQMNTVASLTAPTQQVTSASPDNFTMYAERQTDLEYKYTAIVAPKSQLQEDNTLLNIADADGNDYTVDVSSAILTGWSSQLDAVDGCYQTRPGVDYHLSITLNKTDITVRATIEDWTTIDATGEADIQYPTDIDVDVAGHTFADKSSFTLFWLQAEGDKNDASNERPNDDEAGEDGKKGYAFATVPASDGTKWTNSPSIYWPNASTSYYFRALAQFDASTGTTGTHSIKRVGFVDDDNDPSTPDVFDKSVAVAVSQGTIAAGHDILWGTTAAHNKHTSMDPGEEDTYDYQTGDAIPPRTDDVPIAFEHALSKISIALETSEGAAAVDFTGATISLSHLATNGTIRIEDGEVTPGSVETNALGPLSAISQYIVIPQTITNASKLTITLADGTVYNLQLNLCVNEDDHTAIDQWERGKHYSYTIHLEKEQITFRAVIKDWETHYGSGNANLEWD